MASRPCPSIEQLAAYHRGTASAEAMPLIEAHLEAGCASCDTALLDLERGAVDGLLRRHPPPFLHGALPAVAVASRICVPHASLMAPETFQPTLDEPPPSPSALAAAGVGAATSMTDQDKAGAAPPAPDGQSPEGARKQNVAGGVRSVGDYEIQKILE